MTMLLKTFVACVLMIGCFCNGQEIHIGKCKNITTQSNFDVEKYLGTWFDIEKFYFVGQMDKRCVQARYSPRQDGKIDVLNQDITQENHEENTTGIAYVTDPNVKSKLTVQLQGSPKANYWVVETDYDNYSLVWSCLDLVGDTHAEFCWILSRNPTLDDKTVAMLKEKLDSFGISTNKFYKTNQDNCY